MTDIQMPDGLDQNTADVHRRRWQGGREVDRETGTREVIAEFSKYVRAALEPGGPAELRGRLEEWKTDLETAKGKRAHYSPKLRVAEEVLRDVQEMCVHYGTGAQIQDAVTPAREVSFNPDRWLVNVESGLEGGRDVLTLWHLKRRDEGRSVKGDQTWGDAMGKAVKRWTDYQEWVNMQVDQIETAALHVGLIDHVLRLHREGRLPSVRQVPAEVPRTELLESARAFDARVYERIKDEALTREAAYAAVVVEAGGTRWRESGFKGWDTSARQRAKKDAALKRRLKPGDPE